MAPAAPPELNKASFLIRRDGSATTQNPVKTRQQEMTLTSATSHRTTGQQRGCKYRRTAAGTKPPHHCAAYPITLTCTSRKIPRSPAHWIAALYLTGRGNFAARSLLTSGAPAATRS
ncbi:hypothetical protein LNP74_26940 [Klebsiella pneumoniae subsp. pneumoniae]|nr:hypothetical protein [Klebsiella pneumoniae subsp. pneumoniae]